MENSRNKSTIKDPQALTSFPPDNPLLKLLWLDDPGSAKAGDPPSYILSKGQQ